MSTLIIGAAGAVGTRLVRALASRGDKVVVADRLPKVPAFLAQPAVAAYGNIDVRDASGIMKLFKDNPGVTTVWNLAAPLSVDTAMDPAVAEAVTVGGMKNVLDGMSETGVRRICFTDSIGSFGATAPRTQCTARWLTENPTQDPGSDYGRQKRGCRELMNEFASRGGDPRFAVLPGVLHSKAVWGGGTTEYALDAMQAAARGDDYECPIDPSVVLPMIYVTDLMRGLLSLQDAPEAQLSEPERGYCIPGLSFNAEQLFKEIRRHKPDFKTSVNLNETMNKFAHLWPDVLSTKEPEADLGYAPHVGLREMVGHVMMAQEEFLARSRVVFRMVDDDGNGTLSKKEMNMFLHDLLHVPEDISSTLMPESTPAAHKNMLCRELTEKAFQDIGVKKAGEISYPEFHNWTKRSTLCTFVQDFIKEKGADIDFMNDD